MSVNPIIIGLDIELRERGKKAFAVENNISRQLIFYDIISEQGNLCLFRAVT